MRIVLVFLTLMVVSIAGVGVLVNTVLRGGEVLPAQAAIRNLANNGGSGSAPPPAPPSAETPAQVQPQAKQEGSEPPRPVAAGEKFTFTVHRGETTASVAQRLAEMGMVPHPLVFRFWVQWRGAEGKLQAGEYQLVQGLSMDELIETMQAAKAKDVAITFVEGRRIEEYAEALEKADVGVDAKRFLDLAKRGQFTYDFLEAKPPSASLEGFLFPDTYRVIPGKTTPEELIHMMLKRFGETMTAQVREQCRQNTGLTLYEAVTVASIVEREAQKRDERPTIAAVYLNRLREKEGLFADPTIQYAIGKPGDWWPVLRDLPRNITPDSRYNSYVFAELPPSPIANPGASAFKATCEPAKVDYKYFVRDDVKNDGSHQFARTLAEHERNRRLYQRN
ncbi:MAG: endolytic transglycosylase MltG [Chloroflexi bacterium]|nr:endolytic transglycosylase MltG [Chloroflexota bacterium]